MRIATAAVGLAILVAAVLPVLAADQVPATQPASYVQPLDLQQLRSKLWNLPASQQELIAMYAEAAQRDVLTHADGCVPDNAYSMRYRNLAERAKGAAVLASLVPGWPDELRQRCRRDAAGFVREVAMAHRAKPNLGYEWQAAYWVGEAAIAGWFLWDDLDADLRNAVAEMVVFQADRFVGLSPKMGYRLDTQAETVSWNSSILTLATNMMPTHPHHAGWDEAAKRFIYNTIPTPQDSGDETPGDDGKRVRAWIVGANLYPDFTLENHRQFHIDYVLAAYRYHVQGAVMYWLTGRPLPAAFRLNAGKLYDKVLLRCMTADGFFAFVPDNDWKRYHCWTESCVVHAYIAMLEHSPLAATLERRALRNALAHWRTFPKGFEFENPYVCGKAWTTRIADAVLMHVVCPSAMPEAMPEAKVNTRLQGTCRLESAELLTRFARDGSFASICKGKEDAWVCYAAPHEDAWLFLPLAGNYRASVRGKPVVQPAASRWARGGDWFWFVRTSASGTSGEAFIAGSDGMAVYAHHLAATDLPRDAVVENSIGIEKSFLPLSMHFAGGTAYWQPGQEAWGRDDPQAGVSIPGAWLNVQDRMGVVVISAGSAGRPDIFLPRPGRRDRICIRSKLPATTDQNLCVLMLPGDRARTETVARDISTAVQGHLVTFRFDHRDLVINFGDQPATATLPSSGTPATITVGPRGVALSTPGRRWSGP